MVLGACDANGDQGHDCSASGGFNGMGSDGAQHGSLVVGSQSFARTPVQPGTQDGKLSTMQLRIPTVGRSNTAPAL